MLAMLLVGVATPASATAGPAADRTVAHSYLIDMYEYAQAVAVSAPAEVSGLEAAAGRIGVECQGVLSGVPRESIVGIGQLESRQTARERGEANRRTLQLSDLRAELSQVLSYAQHQSFRPAQSTLLGELKALPSPGDSPLAYLIKIDIAELEAEQRDEGPSVCADMKAWVASDYRTLSAASRVLAEKNEASAIEFLRHFSDSSSNESLIAGEGPAGRALINKTTRLELHVARATANSNATIKARLDAAIGLQSLEPKSEPNARDLKPPVKIATGRSVAGTRYTVWLEHGDGGSPQACKLSVKVGGAEEAEPGLISAFGPETCLGHSASRSAPVVKCEEGLVEIQAQVLQAARNVSLRMSNGRRIVSRPVLVPRRLGGPAAFYFQAVRGPAPIPLALVEQDQHGHALRVLKLQRIVGCTKHPVKYFPGGLRTLARGRVPQGSRFSIVGERYRLFGRAYSRLTLGTGTDASESHIEEDESDSPQTLEEPFGRRVPRRGPLESDESQGCRPHEYSIFYGLLKQPRDTVLAKIAGKLVVLPHVQIPASLHMHGALVYLASAEEPQEVVVRAPGGNVLMEEDLSSQATEARETCEGESEGPGPPPSILGGFGETSYIELGKPKPSR